jgi:SPP1 gp7 family putative phage head morphogenesis protein
MKTLKPVKPSAAIEADYRKKLQRLINEMQASAEYWIRAAYRKDPPRMAGLAQDAVPAAAMKRVIDALAKRWADKYQERAEELAKGFVWDTQAHADKLFQKYLKDAGWTVKFKISAPVRDVLTASVAENVQLIKTIPEQFFDRLNGIVMRSYTAGRDLETMVKEIKATYPVTDRRAILIARDQSNKANAAVNRARQMELGIEEAIWMHSHAGREPRPDHVAANGRRYKVAEGCLISGEYIQPGEKIGCKCGSRVVLPH